MSLNVKRGGILVALLAALALLVAGLGAVPAAQASGGDGQTVSSPPPGQRCGDDIDLESQRLYTDYELSHPLKETAYREVDSDWGCYGARVGTCGQYMGGLYPVWIDFVNRSNTPIWVEWRQVRRYAGYDPATWVSPKAIQPGNGQTGELLDEDYLTGIQPGITDLTVIPLLSDDIDGPRLPGATPMKLSISVPKCGYNTVPKPPTTGGDGDGSTTKIVKTKSRATVTVKRHHRARKAVVRVDARKASHWTTIVLRFRKVHGSVHHRTVGVRAGHRKVIRLRHLKRHSKVKVTLKEKGHKKRVYYRKVR